MNTKRLLLEPEAIRLLETYNVAYPEYGVARGQQEAVDIADRLGYPVVLKVVSPDISHKSDVGGVLVGLSSAPLVRQGYDKIMTEVPKNADSVRIEGVLVCRQARPGLEMIVGGLRDPVFGPVVMAGVGGVFTEILRDVAFRLAPIDVQDAEMMLSELRGYPLLAGARGRPALDAESLAELLVLASTLMIDHPEVEELDLNPVRVYERGLIALDARVLVGS